jgi:hypothetical protein
MSQPQLSDIPETGGGDDDDNETSLQIFDDDRRLCTWSDDPDEHRRAFIIDIMANAEIEGQILVANMDAVFKWLKDGTVPTKSRSLKIAAKKDDG